VLCVRCECAATCSGDPTRVNGAPQGRRTARCRASRIRRGTAPPRSALAHVSRATGAMFWAAAQLPGRVRAEGLSAAGAPAAPGRRCGARRPAVRCDARPLLLQLHLPIVVEQRGDHRGPDVVRPGRSRWSCTCLVPIPAWCTSSSTPPGATAASSARSAAASGVRSRAGVLRGDQGRTTRREHRLRQSGVHPANGDTASRACPAARSSATPETSSAVTSQPPLASQTASAPSPQPTSSTRPGLSRRPRPRAHHWAGRSTAAAGRRTAGPTPPAPRGLRRIRRQAKGVGHRRSRRDVIGHARPSPIASRSRHSCCRSGKTAGGHPPDGNESGARSVWSRTCQTRP